MSQFFPPISSDAVDRLGAYYRDRLAGLKDKLQDIEAEIAAESDEAKQNVRAIQATKLKSKIAKLEKTIAQQSSSGIATPSL